MPTKSYTGTDRRNQTNQIVNQLVQERTKVWSLFCTAADLEPFTNQQSVETKVKEFCQILVDYISLGHFGIYQRIADRKERRSKVIQIAEKIYPRISTTTQSAVEFNDKYEGLDGEALLANLSKDLSHLGEELATRIELEDILVKSMIS